MATASCAALCVFTVALYVVPAESSAVSLLAKSAFRSKRADANLRAGLRYDKEDPAARTLLTLDTNKDGRISPDEVGTWAKAQGLDAESAKEEFSGIDVNNDGLLDAKEITAVLGQQSADAAPAGQAAPQQAAPRQAAAQQAVLHEAAPQQAVQLPPATRATIPEVSADVANLDIPEFQSFQASPSTVPDSAQDQVNLNEFNANAQAAAADVVKQLAYEENQEAEARKLDRKAAELRANSTALGRSTQQDALEAGAKAARDKATALLEKLAKMEDEAERAEVRAAALHAKSRAEVKEAKQLMAITDAALK